ncbi:MAG TPA: hypothetical protein VGM13_00470 [Thermoanaerobaculia bacterium]|jgi:hypothetical protein
MTVGSSSDQQRTVVQLAQYLAISAQQSPREALDFLLPQFLLLLPGEGCARAEDLITGIDVLLGLRLHLPDVETSIQRLESKHRLVRLPGGVLAVEPRLREEIKSRTGAARELQDEVRAVWIRELPSSLELPPPDHLWELLIAYLARVFRAHGLQALSLLVPSVETPTEGANPGALLEEVLTQAGARQRAKATREAIGHFLTGVKGNTKRAAFLSQIADGSFHLFALSNAPEVTEALRGSLRPFVLFVDTNVLLALVGLQDGPQQDTAVAVAGLPKTQSLPIKLRFHEQTRREMSNTIAHYKSRLMARYWPQVLSRVACKNGELSGIELKYHQRNAQGTLLVEDFFAVADDWETVAKTYGIEIYRQEKDEGRLSRRATLEADYAAFLKAAGREDKRLEAVQHDMAVLETVDSLRSGSGSTIGGGAILLTCDHALCVFEWERARGAHRSRGVVLPSILWQALRPYLRSDANGFDGGFAAAFALPELNPSHGAASAAVSRLLSILAGYEGIAEETATVLLANRVLLKTIDSGRSDDELRAAIDNEIVTNNAALLRERVGLEERARASDTEREQAHIARRKAEEVLEKTRSSEQRLLEAKASAEASLRAEQQKRLDAEESLKKQGDDLRVANDRAHRMSVATAVFAGIVFWGVFEVVVRLVRWEWLLGHPNSYGIQGVALMCFFAIAACVLVKRWRRVAWLGVLVPALYVAFQLIGGPRPK